MIVEVLSPSTEAYDRGQKFLHYQKLPSLREYVLISQGRMQVEIFRKNVQHKWEYELWDQPTDPVGLLEMIEDGEIDHKVLAAPPGQNVELDHELHDLLREFIYNIFAQFPGAVVEVGRLLPKQAAIDHIREFRDA